MFCSNTFRRDKTPARRARWARLKLMLSFYNAERIVMKNRTQYYRVSIKAFSKDNGNWSILTKKHDKPLKMYKH